MAVFLAVFWVFSRLGADGSLTAARQEHGGVRRLLVPVIAAAACVAALTLVLNTQLLPRANQRLVTVLTGRETQVRSDRTMTIGELRAAVRGARADPAPNAIARAAAYEVEIQKKYALAAACVVLALAGAAIAIRFPRGGMGLAIVASFAVFGGYWISMIAGEELADELVIRPLVAMWMANVLLFALALVLVWRRYNPTAMVEGS